MFTVKWSISYGIPFIAVFSSHGIRWRLRGVMPCCSPRGFFRSQRLWRALPRGKSLEAGESVVQWVESLCWWILCSSWSKWSWSVSVEMSNFDISMEEHEVWNLPILFVGEVPTDLPNSVPSFQMGCQKQFSGSSSGAPVTLHVYSVSGSQTVCKVSRMFFWRMVVMADGWVIVPFGDKHMMESGKPAGTGSGIYCDLIWGPRGWFLWLFQYELHVKIEEPGTALTWWQATRFPALSLIHKLSRFLEFLVAHMIPVRYSSKFIGP